MAFEGINSAVQAMMGGDRVEQLAYDSEGTRLARAKSAMALMDERVARANMAKRQDQAGLDLQNTLDMSDPLNVAVIAELAGQMSSAETARGTKQENDLQKIAIDTLMAGGVNNMDPKLLNAIQAIAGRGAFMTGSHVDPVADQAANLKYKGAQTEAAEALTKNRNNYSATGEPLYKKVTDGRFAEFIGPDEVGAFARWMQDNKDDFSLRDENQAIQKFRVLVDSGLLDPATGKEISIMSGGSAPPQIKSGSTRETAIPVEELTEEPPIDTWVIINGVRQKYKGQKQ